MIEPRQPRFDWGLRVLACDDLFNDGSYPELTQDELIVPKDAFGEIVRVGYLEESHAPLYLVEFDNGRVVGCLEEEITPVLEGMATVVEGLAHE
ncbi:nitrogen fixation protein NifZ [Halothiobacillus diazotrophicus]|uniref:Nitrogen fixation protein NifZ n=1 Tax=Halothiobacillus diazotrophicus TaxID=1860122 RepID=A0A191ZEH0_9GAMM|nr:nitrogen fixation protein NifZ [Halothiobacillus diazotrophicus]ANJ66264.1 nitrogen fixation protein NifZ [Halothiobacillus diazotrophicus]